jgi:hypothetical protein
LDFGTVFAVSESAFGLPVVFWKVSAAAQARAVPVSWLSLREVCAGERHGSAGESGAWAVVIPETAVKAARERILDGD